MKWILHYFYNLFPTFTKVRKRCRKRPFGKRRYSRGISHFISLDEINLLRISSQYKKNRNSIYSFLEKILTLQNIVSWFTRRFSLSKWLPNDAPSLSKIISFWHVDAFVFYIKAIFISSQTANFSQINRMEILLEVISNPICTKHSCQFHFSLALL